MNTESPPMDLRQCRNCGDFMNKRKLWDGTVVCSNCGQRFPEPPPQPRTPSYEATKRAMEGTEN